jgi:Fe-S-cluster-containing dehydrogenase component
MRYGIVIDLKRCIGCYGCQILCKSENGTSPGINWSHVVFSESGKYPTVRKDPLPMLCMQCGDPKCVEVCPTGASIKRSDGIVTIDAAKCLGCESCVLACPYRARTLFEKAKEYFPGQGFTRYEEVTQAKHSRGVVEKCNFCLPRIENGLEPACVAGCMAKARYFGNLADPESQVSKMILSKRAFQMHAELGTDPSVYYLAP